MDNPSQNRSELSPLKQAFLAIEKMEARLAAMEQSKHAPIAIIGMACRFPGGANDPESYWELLNNGIDAICEVPANRWDINAYYDPDPDAPGKMCTRGAGFVKDIDQFDPLFFGISPREVTSMDPQQRLLLEVTWEALESAGQAPDQLMGSRTGVFVGIVNNDYQQLQLKDDGISQIDMYYGSGIGMSIASGRISYILGLRGPSISIDTACSSSLVAVHLAVQSLRIGECNLALAGGSNAILCPDGTIALSRYHFMSPDSHCKTFDARGDGYARGEGCGIVVLKRLSEALADGDHILAVILGSAVNQDGASSGLTAPNGQAQEMVYRDALADAQISPAEVSFIEAHGTGTSLGDPIELQAMARVFKEGHTPENPLLVGAVKTNIGHLESAAGIAGILKLILAMKHRTIPPNLHFEQPTPHVDWKNLPLKVPTQPIPWEAEPRLVAGVSSFGFSGTNVHILLAEPPRVNTVAPGTDRPVHILTLSAKSEKALKELAGRFSDHLSAHPEESIADVAFTANQGRAHFDHRLALIAPSVLQAQTQLSAFMAGQTPAGLVNGKVQTPDRPRIAFLYTGQGSQYAGMGRALYETQPTFRMALDRCAAILQPYLDRPLLSVIFAAENSPEARLLDDTAYTQPALFSLEYALTELWRSWGIEPAAVMGHSVGEYAAACVAGIFSLEDGLALIAERGRLMSALPAGGVMAAAFSDETRITAALAPYEDQIAVAAINGPGNIVISGVGSAVQAVLDDLAAQGIKSRRLTVSHAFHSPLMDPILTDFERAAGKVSYQPPHILFISNLTGRGALGTTAAIPDYWLRHLRHPVRFAEGMGTLFESGYEVFLEVGPTPTLIAMGQRCLQEGSGMWFSSLRKGQDDWQQMLSSLAGLYCYGAQIDWSGYDRDYAVQGIRHRLSLPTYPFQHKRYWLPKRSTLTLPKRKSSGKKDALLGSRVRSALKEQLYESVLSTGSFPFLADHRVQGNPILPTTAYLEMALEAADALKYPGQYSLEDLEIHRPLIFIEEREKLVQTILRPINELQTEFQIYSLDGKSESEDWMLHMTGRFKRTPDMVPSAPISILEIQARCEEEIPPIVHYQRLADRGIRMGPSMQNLVSVRRRDGEALGLARLGDGYVSEKDPFHINPALLDVCLQIVEEALPQGLVEEDAYLPVTIDSFQFYQSPGIETWNLATIHPISGSHPDTLTADLSVMDETGKLIASLKGLKIKRASQVMTQTAPQPGLKDSLYTVGWMPQRSSPDTILASMPSPVKISEQAASCFMSLSVEHGLNKHHELVSRLEELSVEYILKAFRELGWKPSPGQRVTVAGLAKQLGVIDQHLRLLRRFLEILTEEGILRQVEDAWEVRVVPETQDAPPNLDELAKIYPDSQALLPITERCGNALGSALIGEADALQLLFPNGSFELAEKLYQDTGEAKTFNGFMQEHVRAILSALPSGCNLRILEIGAGTGGITSAVLPILPADTTEYTFTDIAPLFLVKARQKFSKFPFVNYQVLDIEKNPQEQGFVQGSFDIVLAANVIHATLDLKESLHHIQQLLAPGGILLLLEATGPERWIDVSFGLTKGWWRFTDHELRKSYPLISSREWINLLIDSGFTDPVAFPSSSEITKEAIILGRAPSVKQTILDKPGSWLIFADQSGVGQLLAEELRSRGQFCSIVMAGEADPQDNGEELHIQPAQPEHFIQLLKEFGQPLKGVIHLWSLDIAYPEVKDAKVSSYVSLESGQSLGTGSLLHLVQAIGMSGQAPRLWAVTRDAQGPVSDSDYLDKGCTQAPIWGLGKVIELEHPEYQCRLVDLDPSDTTDIQARQLIEEIISGDYEEQVSYRQGMRYAARLVKEPLKVSLPQPLQLVSTGSGILDDLALAPSRRRVPGKGEVEIRIHATGLNFHDVLNGLGVFPEDEPFGIECTGKIVSVGEGVEGFVPGDKVVAAANDSFATFVTVDAGLVAHLPDSIDYTQAATIPAAYMTAHYALNRIGQLTAKERVLIHSAAGGVGQAAVRIALQVGAEIFGTAGSPEKRAFLKSQGVHHVFDSRSLDFASEIMEITHGQGVDIVLNSLAGGFISKSLSVLADHGRFLEIGRRDIWTHAQVAEVKPFASYHIIDLAALMKTEPDEIRSTFQEVISAVMAGKYTPLPVKTFPLEQVSDAFRYMAQAKHIGKIVVVQEDESQAKITEQESAAKGLGFVYRPRPKGTYLVTGGFSGLGLLAAYRLVERGARYLALIGRSEPSDTTKATLAEMEHMGAQVCIFKADVSRFDQMAEVFREMERTMPPLLGVIHSAGTLEDGALMRQDWGRFTRVMAPKVDGAWILHLLTAGAPLDFFVLFSSTAALLGSPGQGNHAAANSFLDALAHLRKTRGLPALSINWGVWSEVGSAARRNVGERIEQQGVGTISPQEGLEILDQLFLWDQAQIAVLPVDWIQFIHQYPTPRPPRFLANFIKLDSVSAPKPLEPDIQPPAPRDFRTRLKETPANQQFNFLLSFVSEQAVKVLNLELDEPLDLQKPLNEMGLDSLMAVELRNRLSAGMSLERLLPASLVFDYPTVEAMAKFISKQVLGLELSSTKGEAGKKSTTTDDLLAIDEIPVTPETKDQRDTFEMLNAIENLSDEEIEQLYESRLGKNKDGKE